jgi:DNA helicase-2/ATP-dependent DNA helicase PcrA
VHADEPAPTRAAPLGGSPSEHAQVRDVLAWTRLLADPNDAAAVVRALARPPIELRQVELARVIQVARRRTPWGTPRSGGQAGKLDLIAGLRTATESPQVPPEARERIVRFLGLHAEMAVEFDSAPPDAFIARLIRRLDAQARPLLVAREAGRQGVGLRWLQQRAAELVQSTPLAGNRELARHLAAVVPEAGRDQPRAESPALPQRDPDGPDEAEGPVHATLELLREELLEGVAHIGGRLGELRLDTDLDISHGVARYLELLKVSALLQRPSDQSLGDALADINARLLAAATPLQREILHSSPLDDALVDAANGESQPDGPGSAGRERVRARTLAPSEQHSLDPFLPRRGVGLALSASDIHTYRSCPLRYKYARVLRIPVEQTVHQRFGIVVHQVLERYHGGGGGTLEQMLSLLEAGWRRAGFGDGQRDGALYEKARTALARYHARLARQDSQPVWFERQFDFRIGPHHLRGRVDRVDRLGAGAGAEYELIDYKTSRPKSDEQLRADIQLSLYALAALEQWGLGSSRQAYYYVLDDLKVPVPHGQQDGETVKGIVLEVGAGILAQEFEPTPSPAACSMCDYRIVCPAAQG